MRWEIAQWFETRWWSSYLKDKSIEDYTDWKRKYWATFLTDLNISLKAGSNVLDAGCGPAGINIILDDSHVLAIDPLLNEYKSKGQLLNPDSRNVIYRQQKLEELDEASAHDFVFCLNVINHVRNMDLALSRLLASAKEGATIVVSTDCHNYSLFKWLFRLIPLDILHPHQYDLKEYEAFLRFHNAKIERVHKIKTSFFFDYYAIVASKN